MYNYMMKVVGISVRAVELFCGAGGMSRGLIDAGIQIVKAYDSWPVAVENYRENIGPHVEEADLKDLLSVVPDILSIAPDLICGGPPCQDYSLAGRRHEGERAGLTVAFAIVVTSTRPQWFIMENVIQASKSDAWAQSREMLKRAGYGLTEAKINSALYGVPQSRKRLFVIGRLGERDGFLQSAVASKAAPQPMTLRDFFGTTLPTTMFFPATSSARRSVRFTDEPAPTIRERSIRPIPEFYRPHPADAALIENGYVFSRPVRGTRGVRSIEECFPTVTRTSWERPGPKYISDPHPDDPVPAVSTAALTRDQASRIQGFPADWVWIATAQRDILQMIANAVPAPVARVIGQVILARHQEETLPAIEGRFLNWLALGARSRATARNVKANVNRARRLLGGRTFADIAQEIVALEAAPAFGKLEKGIRSDLRQALRLHAEFQSSKSPKARKGTATAPSAVVGDGTELAAAA